MNDIALSVENISKMYRLGEVGTGTLSHDLNRWWAKVRSKEDPYTEVGQVNDRTQKAKKGEHVWALKDINFKVNKGDVLGIIGKNGAGKSTLLKVISSITAPTKGEIKFNGRIASLLEVGTGMHPELTGRENVFLNGAILGMTKAEIRSKFDDIMDFAGCAKYSDTPVKRYSSGMKVRLGFAVAAFLEPEILIVDEVLAVGDAEFQRRAIGKMKEISKGGGRTVLFVSHNMASVRQLCKSAVLLENGSIKDVGKPNYIISKYINERNNENGLVIDNSIDTGIIDLNLIENCQNIENNKEYSALNPLNILFTLKNPFNYECRVSIGFKLLSFLNEEYIRVGTAFSDYYGTIITLKEGETKNIVSTNNIYLTPNKYKLVVELWAEGIKYDSKVKELHFEVSPVDIFKSGYVKFTSVDGPMVWNSKFEEI